MEVLSIAAVQTKLKSLHIKMFIVVPYETACSQT